MSDLTASAVLRAIEEFDQLGRDAFLEKYGFGKAREYLIQKDGRLYDSKAIVGAAHGYLPGQTALKPNEFSGGEATVKKTLDALKIDEKSYPLEVVAGSHRELCAEVGDGVTG